MILIQTLQMAVESPVEGIRVVRTAGSLDRQSAAGLLRLVDAQIALVAGGHRTAAHLIVDLENVNRFDPGGMETLHTHRAVGRDRGVQLHLAGGGRLMQLPIRVRQLLRDFSIFPTTEIAVAALAGPARTPPQDPAPAVEPEPALHLPESRRPEDRLPEGRIPESRRSPLDRIHVIARDTRRPHPTGGPSPIQTRSGRGRDHT